MTLETGETNQVKSENAILEIVTKTVGLSSTLVLSIALSTDLGTFYGIDVSYFTFFTLTEHVLFTIEFIPIAFVYAFCIVAWALLSKIYMHESRSAIITLLGSYMIIVGSIFLVALVRNIAGFGLDTLMMVSIAVGIPVSVVVILRMIDKSSLHDASKSKRRSATLVICAYALALLASFFLGVLLGKRLTSPQGEGHLKIHNIVTREFGDISGRVIRSGGSGILLFDTDHREIVFIKWDSIQKVISPEKKIN
jgi:hypothetical protein